MTGEFPLHRIGYAGLLLLGVVMLYMTWGTWPDPVVDFGGELYVPWQIIEGKSLYGDLPHLYGPLSQYLNALWFSLFGVSLRTLVLCNIAIAAGVVALLYRLLRRIGGHLGAWSGCAVFITLFACSQYMTTGNYNFITPYAHEITHGFALALVGLWCLTRIQDTGKLIWWILAGLCLGMIFLTKIEIFLAAAVAMAVGLGARSRPRYWGLFTAATCFPVVIAFLSLTIAMPAKETLGGLFGPWAAAFDSDVRELLFYRGGMGLDDPVASLRSLTIILGWYAAFLVPALAVSRWIPKRAACIVLFILPALLLWPMRDSTMWFEIGRPLPFIMIGLGIFAFREKKWLRLTMIIFALALMPKMILNARLHHYGFVLALPATMLLIVALTSWLPEWMRQRGGSAAAMRAFALGLIFMTVLVYGRAAGIAIEDMTYTVGSGGDAFKVGTDYRGLVRALDQIEDRLEPGEKFLVLPEGVMLNYLLRRESPTPFYNFMPPEVATFGEDRMIAALDEDPPDYIVVVPKTTLEYGVGPFGEGYATRIARWVTERGYRGSVLSNEGVPVLLLRNQIPYAD